MKRFKCVCGNDSFKANPDSNMIQCWVCGQRYFWGITSVKWCEFNLSAKDRIRDFCFNPPKEFIENVSKACKDLWPTPKLRHPKRDVLKRLEPFKASDYGKPIDYYEKKKIKEEHLKAKWNFEIIAIRQNYKLLFPHQYHKGKLRGKNIAKACHRDLKRLGIKTRLKFEGNKGIVEVVK